MYFRSLIPALLLLMSTASAVYSQDARLSYNLVPGKHYILDIDIQQTTSSESMNSEDISMYSRMKLEFLVDSAAPSGLIHMTVRYHDLLLSMLAPGMGLDINSGTGQNPILSNLIDTLANQRFRVSMRESGELHSVEGLHEIFTSMAAFPAGDTNRLKVIHSTINEAYGPDAFESLFNLLITIYPNVQPIKNWTRDFTYYLNSKPVQMANRFFHTRTSEELVTIQGMGMLNSLEPFTDNIALGEVQSTVSGSQTYDFQVARNSGWLEKCLSRQRVKVETTIVKSTRLPEGLKIPSYTETLFDVKGYIQ